MKGFKEVFPTLILTPELDSQLKDAEVKNVSMVKSGGFLRVRLFAPSLDNASLNELAGMISSGALEGKLGVQVINDYEEDLIPWEAGPSFEGTVYDGIPAPDEDNEMSGPAAPSFEADIPYPEPADSGALEITPAPAPGEEEYETAALDYDYIPPESGSPALKSGGFNKSGYKRKKKETDPDMLYGRSFEGPSIEISDILAENRNAIIEGEICKTELTVTSKGTEIFKIDVTDFKDTISSKIFLGEGEDDLPDKFKNGMHIKMHGRIEYDNFEGEMLFTRVEGIKLIDRPFIERLDTCPDKRVELHLHTKFSDMDATTDVEKAIRRAIEWGHKAIAITDHGVVQAFPPAMHALEAIEGEYKKKDKELDFKIIYGCEGYIVDDMDDPVLTDKDGDIELIRRFDSEGNPTNDVTPEMEAKITKVKKKQSHHIILLAANETGRINLYRLVSFSHINYFNRRPRIPKSVLNRYREGLIVGSACVAGELADAILSGESEERLKELVDYYDYLEIQPIGNNQFLIRNYENNVARGHKVKDEEGLRDMNRKIVELGDKYGKRIVATGDVHFLDPQDEVFRRIILDSQKFDDADFQPPLYFHTTDEMLEEFSYLGEERAFEAVVTNPNWVADQIEKISPVRPDKCPPVIENSEEKLRDMCYENAKKMYGDPLPEVVEKRLERELNSIISNGYAVLYIIAMELVTKSVSDGYLVGSRGSVGSSFAATTASITEVNPLPPHYRCKKCLYSDFDSPEVKAFAGGAGCDMPDKICPVCGEPLFKDGFDIPFETFMGFKGDKEPDIDLNFSGEYQARAHAYTETLFGKGHTFRAGTLSGLQEKTIYGFTKKYFEHHNKTVRQCEVNRIIRGCLEVKRSTGQHPGGIVVLPHGEEIYSFTPVQHPANDAEKNIITTHFDYHSIDHNLLKLDELGHDDPTMIRMLEDLTGINAREIRLDDPSVMQLFDNIEILGVKPEDVDGYELGTLGIPEFGTDFVMQMLKDTKPKNYSDLVRIAGLSHGTDVWLNNAQTLVKDGKATLSSCICTRDDIMTYLMQKDLEPSMAFDIMENVRKGKVAGGKVADKWEVWKKAMEEHNVPDWYMWSCERIQYMFPKAHAVAYVMMAYRIAYFKIFYPLAYYAAYFSIRASAFNYELMCQGKDKLLEQMDIVKRRLQKGEATPKDEVTLRDMHSVLEMYARGFEFAPIDLYKSHATRFSINDGKVLPAFTAIDGMGEKAAISLEEAARTEKFTSREDLKTRGKVTSTIADKMFELGILGNMPESSQISFKDLFGIS